MNDHAEPKKIESLH